MKVGFRSKNIINIVLQKKILILVTFLSFFLTGIIYYKNTSPLWKSQTVITYPSDSDIYQIFNIHKIMDLSRGERGDYFYLKNLKREVFIFFTEQVRRKETLDLVRSKLDIQEKIIRINIKTDRISNDGLYQIEVISSSSNVDKIIRELFSEAQKKTIDNYTSEIKDLIDEKVQLDEKLKNSALSLLKPEDKELYKHKNSLLTELKKEFRINATYEFISESNIVKVWPRIEVILLTSFLLSLLVSTFIISLQKFYNRKRIDL